MPSRSPRPLRFGPLLERLSPLLLGSPLVGALSAALLAGCTPPTTPAEPALAEPVASCSVESPEVNEFGRLDPLSSFSPAGGTLGNPSVKPYRGFYSLFAPPAQPREVPGGAAEFRLTAKPVVSPGESLGLQLHLINRSRGPLTVLRPSVGGEFHPYYPYYDLYLRPENDHRSYLFAYANDLIHWGTRGPLGADEYLDVASGKAATLDKQEDEGGEGVSAARLFSPGRYVLWSVYRFCGAPGSGSEVLRPDALRGEYASNSVTVEVR